MTLKHLIVFQPSGRRGEIDEGKNLLDAARELGADIRAECGGQGICGKCRVAVTAGREALAPPTEAERELLRSRLEEGYRLACHALIAGPLQVMVPPESQTQEPIILTESEACPFRLEPLVYQYHLKVPPPSLDSPSSDAERLLQALERTYGLKGVGIAHPLLGKLPTLLRRAGWDVTVTLRDWGRREIIGLQPGYIEATYGMAVDIGTTTVVGYLTDLSNGTLLAVESITNPQVAYGEDIMTRIHYAATERRGLQRLRDSIRQGLHRMIRSACAEAGISPRHIAEMTIVGNTAMHHLFLGIEPLFLARAPFSPAVRRHCDIPARDLGLPINPAANVHLLPLEAGFVGADNVGVLIATEPHRREEVSLVIDIGTSTEMVLGNRELGLTACSVPAGPALEGAHIRFGMRAAPGAIERVRIDTSADGSVRYQTIGNTEPRGICGSGIVDALAAMLKAGIVLPNGRMNPSAPYLRQGPEGPEFVLEWGPRTALQEDIVITQGDVREIQLVKGAFHAAVRLLLKGLGVDSVQRIVLAGAFGSRIDPRSAMSLGLLPTCDPERVTTVGNAAGHGARMALLSRSKRVEAIKIARQVRYVELSASPDFQRLFLAGLNFPEP